MKTIPKLPDRVFTTENAVCNNGVFLFTNTQEPPFMGPAKGWKIVGWGKAPWARQDSTYAVMFERTEPEDLADFNSAPEGTMLWQHCYPRWVPGTPEYEEWCK